MFGTLGFTEVAVIFLLALVLFGPKKLPELGRTIGKAMTEFRRASNDLKATFDREMQTLERETQPVKAATQNIAREIRDETYAYTPPANAWNPLDQSHVDQSHVDQSQPNPEHDGETASQPTSVGTSEVLGAESNGTAHTAETPAATSTETSTEATVETAQAEPASPLPGPNGAPEGTVPRGASEPRPSQTQNS